MQFPQFIKQHARIKANNETHQNAKALFYFMGAKYPRDYKKELLAMRSAGKINTEDYEHYCDALETLMTAAKNLEPMMIRTNDWIQLGNGGHLRKNRIRGENH